MTNKLGIPHIDVFVVSIIADAVSYKFVFWTIYQDFERDYSAFQEDVICVIQDLFLFFWWNARDACYVTIPSF